MHWIGNLGTLTVPQYEICYNNTAIFTVDPTFLILESSNGQTLKKKIFILLILRWQRQHNAAVVGFFKKRNIMRYTVSTTAH